MGETGVAHNFMPLEAFYNYIHKFEKLYLFANI